MAEYLSPGVYVEEYDSSPRTIEGVGTSTAGFIGMTVKGPTLGAPALVTSFADFQRQFGGHLSEYTHGEYRYLPYAVEQFFVNGGTRCYVARVVPDDAKIATAQTESLTLRAANEGRWGNRILVNFTTVNRRKMQLLAKESELVYRAKNVSGFHEGDVVELAGELNRIAGIFENSVTFEQAFTGDPVDTALVPKSVLYSVEMDITIRYEGETETYAGVNLNPTSPNYLADRLRSSALVAVEDISPTPELQNPVSLLLGEGKLAGALTLTGGSDGTMERANAGTYIGVDNGPGRRSGIQSFVENTVASIIAIPGITIPDVVVSWMCPRTGSRSATCWSTGAWWIPPTPPCTIPGSRSLTP